MNILITMTANDTIKKHIDATEFKEMHSAIREDAIRGHKTTFVTNLQNLITKVGLIISEVSLTDRMQEGTFIGSINYLCNVVLKQQSLYNHLRASDINVNANRGKHTLESYTDVDIDECLHQYNRLIDALYRELKVEAIAQMNILLTTPKPTITQTPQQEVKPLEEPKKEEPKVEPPKPRRDIFAVNSTTSNGDAPKKVSEFSNVSYEVIAGNQVTVSLAKNFNLDAFTRTVTVACTFEWKDPNHDVYCIDVESNKSHAKLVEDYEFELDESKKHVIPLMFKQKDVDIDTVSVAIRLVAKRIQTVSIRAESATDVGFFVKKRSYSTTVYENEELARVDTKRIVLSQKFD